MPGIPPPPTPNERGAGKRRQTAEGISTAARQASSQGQSFPLVARAKLPVTNVGHATGSSLGRPAFAKRVKKRQGNASSSSHFNSRASTGRPSVGPRANVPVLCRIARAGWAVASLERASPASSY